MSCRRSLSCIWWIFILLHALCETSTIATSTGFVRTSNTQFVLNGAPFLFNGFNSYWMMNVAVEPSERHKVSEVFHDASAAGLTVCRTWAFADGGDRALQISPGVYDERVFQALDFVISEAGKYGIRLVLSFVNNYNDYGGRAQYVRWARSAGMQINGDDDFYTNAVVKQYYKNHVQKVLTRMNTITRMAYKDDPTIMSWELINEPRCQADYSGKTVHRWMSSHWTDSKMIVRKPLVFAEFGKSNKNPGYSLTVRNTILATIYNNIYNDARSGGSFGGGMVWQLVAEGMESYYDGYEIVLSQNPSTTGIITTQSQKMTALSHLLSIPLNNRNP
ncbi:hypothetical protein IFM89_018390 [Coptis chinensis]|uniref:mannan endo-1,4-beta-mannosidase n=1 Tax=Coptis chinensis TaxID=261450 RepID=A0A835HID9_9MAGN|nr:hypothetical protein IFM89_018390 [Coptis chinensis]